MKIEKILTPHEKYKQGMVNINDANKEIIDKNSQEIDVDLATKNAEKILDNIESKNIDKNMGNIKEPITQTVTAEQYIGMKEANDAAKALRSLHNAQKEHLGTEDIKTMHLITAEFESKKIKDPVLLMLLEEKVELSKMYVKGTLAIKELQRKLLSELSKSTNNMLKAKGAMEEIDKLLIKQYAKTMV